MLTITQKRVLGAINAYPEYNDRELAELLEMKRSTVTAARHFLLKNELYRTILFPDFTHLGAHLLGLIYGEYGTHKLTSYEERLDLRPQNLAIPEYVFSLSSKYNGVSLCFSRDLHTLKEPFESWKALFKTHDPSIAVHCSYFPLPMIQAYKFLDMQRYLTQQLGIEPLLSQQFSRRGRQKLTRKERKVLLEWLAYPIATNEILGVKAGVSRAVVGAIKKRLLLAGLVQMIAAPNWSKLGVELGVLFHCTTYKNYQPLLKLLRQKPEVILLLGTAYEVVFFFLAKDFQEYSAFKTQFLEHVRSSQISIDTVREMVFPMPELKVHLEGSLLAHKLLGS